MEPDDINHEPTAAAMRAECERLCALNGNTLTPTAFSSLQQHGLRQGIQSYLGDEDRRFLSKKSFESRFPAAQSSGGPLSLQRSVELGVLSSVTQFLNLEPPGRINSWRNSSGETLLHIAVLHQHVQIVQTLLEHGADPTIELPGNGVSQSTLESVAPRSDNFKYSRMLHAAEATPVHYACAVGNLDTLKLLLSAAIRYKPTPQFTIRRAGSLLIWAVTAGHPPVVEYLLLKKKLEEDCFDEDGNNSFGVASLALGKSIHAAVLKDIIRILARADGIDINHKNMNGLTAYDTAEELRVKELLQRFGGRSARVLDMDKLLRWDRERSRVEYTYSRQQLGAYVRNSPSNNS